MTTSQPTDPAGPTAALINGIFIQGFELDDWHSEAPLHSSSIVVPALFSAAAAQNHLSSSSSQSGARVTRADFSLGYLAGLEVGPRVGNVPHADHILTMGWHSGAVFGGSASATTVSKMFSLNAGAIEDALGIACTQSCGLMSAQFESQVKRMQHGFAARNGLFAAFLAKGGYIGIKRVYEREYGGFLDMSSKGMEKEPRFFRMRLWQATHGAVDYVRILQKEHLDMMVDSEGIETERPLTSVGAQMSAAHVAATQIVDRDVMARQFRSGLEEREDGGGVNPELSNEEIVEKWRGLMNGVIDEKRRDEIEKTCLGIEEFDDVMELGTLLAGMMKNVIPQGVGRGFGFFFFCFGKRFWK
ncbi:hypothetical protein BKA61DRAFT_631014 [Leptodontidium sp. MPI-SDFR-AT-0119]|nr:hypothetical protein BKA61DRAFT_631014 [Leptodontidium sp. MPI-SDFR-AT-0119]